MSLPAAARTETGFLNRSISVSGAEYRYQVYVPAQWNKHGAWPVILALHGAGERGDGGLLQTDVGMGHAIRQHPDAWSKFIIVMPQCRKERLWTQPEMEQVALAALERSIKEFHGDRSRLYLTGLSMGGYGTWSIASHHPEMFAALVPICGGIEPPPALPALRTDLASDYDPYRDTAQKIGKIPTWVFHGADDPVVAVAGSQKMVEALKAVGANVRYNEYPGVQHNSWDKAYAEPELPAWLLSQHR
jgi:predicted peptidase